LLPLLLSTLQAAASAALCGMPIALNHPALNADQHVLCKAPAVCKGWRDAVNSCGARNLAVKVNATADLQHLLGFQCWLQKHAELVSSITVSVPSVQYIPGKSWPDHLRAADELLRVALQLAGESAEDAQQDKQQQQQGRLQLAGDSAEQSQQDNQKQQQQGRLQLRSFSTGLPSAGLLAALPAHSLTWLEFDFPCNLVGEMYEGPALAATMANLTNLQQLSIDSQHGRGTVPGSCLPGISKLSSLTSFKLGGECSYLQEHLHDALAALAGLQQLQQLLLDDVVNPPIGLNVAQLTNLTELRVSGEEWAIEDIDLPTQLQRLRVGPTMDEDIYSKIMQMQQLQHLNMEVDSSSVELLQLTQLPALQHIALVYRTTAPAAATAALWRQLKRLKELKIDIDDHENSLRRYGAMVPGLAGCTALTKLTFKPCLDFSKRSDGEGDYEDVSCTDDEDDDVMEDAEALQADVFALIASLTILQELRIEQQQQRRQQQPAEQ
jgi:hypothetical protein